MPEGFNSYPTEIANIIKFQKRLENSLRPINGNQEPHTTIKELIRQQLYLTIQEIPKIFWGDDIEAVHKTRVGFRRLRTQIQIGKPFFKKKTRGYLGSESKHVGQVLGQVRDLDVFKLNLNQSLNNFSTNFGFNEELWNSIIKEQYDIARANLLVELGSQRFERFMNFFVDFVEDPKLGLRKSIRMNVPKSQNLHDYLSYYLQTRYNKIIDSKDTLSMHAEDADFHNLRIEVKRFRYSIDFFSPLLNPIPALQHIDALVKLQDHLGELNDQVIANELLETIITKNSSGFDPEMIAFISQYRSIVKQSKNNLQDTFDQSWRSYQELNPKNLLANSLKL